MDSFIEYMIKQRKTASALVKKILVYFAALIVSLLVTAITLIFPSMFMSLIPLAIVLIFYLAYRISSTYDVEFEYILTNGELDVDKITHKKRRKRLMTIHCKSFTEFGKCDKSSKGADSKGEYARIINASANSDTFDDYYAVFYKNGQKIKLIFNPTQRMIDIFKIYAPRVVK